MNIIFYNLLVSESGIIIIITSASIVARVESFESLYQDKWLDK